MKYHFNITISTDDTVEATTETEAISQVKANFMQDFNIPLCDSEITLLEVEWKQLV